MLPESSASRLTPSRAAPATKPGPVCRLNSVSASEGRSASSGVTRLALSAGSKPANTVTPMPSAIETTKMTGETTGLPILKLMYWLIIGPNALSPPAPNR